MRRIIPNRAKDTRKDGGYVLLTLLLAMSVLIIAAGVAASSIAFSIRRDREEELIHRGVQYTRAIREYSKKTGRFPMKLEDLDNVNGRRFLRKHYKDPITGEDFKLVYMTQVVRGSVPPQQANANSNGAPGLNSQDTTLALIPTSTTSPSTTDNQSALDDSSSGAPKDPASSSNETSDHQPISGGLIVGVVSRSKDRSIREFSGKNQYDQWRFYYDPAFDRYALSNAPTVKPAFPSPSKIDGAHSPGDMSSAASRASTSDSGPGQYQP